MLNISAILLGAGESKRMGIDKLSIPWGKKTVFEHSLDALLRSKVKEVIVVLSGWTKTKVDHIKDKKMRIVINPHYKKGMSTSIRKGIQAIDPGNQGILIALGDQPLIKKRTVNALINAFEKRKRGIIIPSFKGVKGHPVIFHRKYKKELLQLKGDVGGKSIIERHPEDVGMVQVKSEGVVRDIDTWKDYTPTLSLPPAYPACGRQAQAGTSGEGKREGKEKKERDSDEDR
jgi:molybdenum cofactor cytidylyltransferase